MVGRQPPLRQREQFIWPKNPETAFVPTQSFDSAQRSAINDSRMRGRLLSGRLGRSKGKNAVGRAGWPTRTTDADFGTASPQRMVENGWPIKAKVTLGLGRRN